MPSTVEEALGKAGRSLEKALSDVRDGNKAKNTTTSSSHVETENSSGNSAAAPQAVDPDDLAAAFFAQQALQKEKETKLDVEDWAMTISKSFQRRNELAVANKLSLSSSPSGITSSEMKERRAALKKAIVNQLLNEYKTTLEKERALM